jgi:hypothetical protein
MEKSRSMNCDRKGMAGARAGRGNADRTAPALVIARRRIAGDGSVSRDVVLSATGSTPIEVGSTPIEVGAIDQAPIEVRRRGPDTTALDRIAALPIVAVAIEAPIGVPRIVTARRIEVVIAAPEILADMAGGRERRTGAETVPWGRVARAVDSVVLSPSYLPLPATVCD